MATFDFQLVPGSALTSGRASIPDLPGAYLIVLDDREGPVNELRRLVEQEVPLSLWPLLYVGATGDSLSLRLNHHFGLDSRQSSLRQSAGLLLDEDLGLGLNRIAGKRYFCFHHEARLTDWLASNTVVGFCPHPEPFEIERFLLESQPGLLNIAGRPPTRLQQRVIELRRGASGRHGFN